MDTELVYIRKLCKKTLACEKSLLELTTYDNVAMWWIRDIQFYYFIKNAISDDISAKSNHQKIFMMLYKTFRYHIEFFFYIEFLYDLSLKFLVRAISRLLGKHDQSEEKSKSKILFVATDNEWRFVRDYETNKLKKSDAIFDSIITKNNRYNFLGVYPIELPTIRGLKIFVDKLRIWDIIHKPLNLYWSLEVWKKERNAFKHFKKSWNCLKDDEGFKKMCICNGKDLSNQILKELEIYFLFLFPRAVKYIEMGREMIKAEKPVLILLQNEYGSNERCYLVVAANLENIPTLAVQHGVIHPTHAGYIYAKDEISPEGSVKSPYCPIPDRTAVYGTYHKDILTKVSAYPEDSVVVTGQPRYDILYHADKIYDKEKFIKKYKINPDHKIILWTTQCHGLSEEENIKNFKAVFETMRNLKDVTLVIKQHPGEGRRYTKMIGKYLNKYKLNAVVMPKDSDTYEQIFVCDLMMTRHSTTAMEAVALNKPVIILNLSGEPDPVDYVKEGVALGVYKEEDLKPTIERLLKDDSELAKNRKRYIEKYLYKIDGKATERVVKLIGEMIEESKRKKNGN